MAKEYYRSCVWQIKNDQHLWGNIGTGSDSNDPCAWPNPALQTFCHSGAWGFLPWWQLCQPCSNLRVTFWLLSGSFLPFKLYYALLSLPQPSLIRCNSLRKFTKFTKSKAHMSHMWTNQCILPRAIDFFKCPRLTRLTRDGLAWLGLTERWGMGLGRRG